MKRVLEVQIEPGDRKVVIKTDDDRPDVAEVEIQREDGHPLLVRETMRREAA